MGRRRCRHQGTAARMTRERGGGEYLGRNLLVELNIVENRVMTESVRHILSPLLVSARSGHGGDFGREEIASINFSIVARSIPSTSTLTFPVRQLDWSSCRIVAPRCRGTILPLGNHRTRGLFSAPTGEERMRCRPSWTDRAQRWIIHARRNREESHPPIV